MDSAPTGLGPRLQSEDMLRLNIWTPSLTGNRAVMFEGMVKRMAHGRKFPEWSKTRNWNRLAEMW